MFLINKKKNLITQLIFGLLCIGITTFFSNESASASARDELIEWMLQASADQTLLMCNASRGEMITRFWCRSPGLLRSETTYSHASLADLDSQNRPWFLIYECIVHENGGRSYSIQSSINQQYLVRMHYRDGSTFPQVFEGRLDSESTSTVSLLWNFNAIMPDACKR